MKKFIQLIIFCVLALSLNAQNNCHVSMIMDSTATGQVGLTALPDGTSPFTYLWSTGETTPSVIWQPNSNNYCVTITDATGCTATACLFNPPPPSCSVSIHTNPVTPGLTAMPTGTAPFAFLWSNGSTSQTLLVNASGDYCVTVTDANGCTATDCAWYGGGGGGQDSCSVFVAWDSLPSGGITLTAYPTGHAPFLYQWSNQNVSAPTITVPGPGTYCVTITDAEGCTAADCITIVVNNPCNVWIHYEDSIGVPGLYAIAHPANVSYLWNTGETSSVIFPTTTGTYCVTITGGGCTATDCLTFQAVNNFVIHGYVYLPDSNNVNYAIEGTVELYTLDNNSNAWYLVNTVDIENNPNGLWNYYNFGPVPAGQYLIKAVPDPAWPYIADYLPTYHVSTIYWDEAQTATVPAASGQYNITLSDGQNLTGGEGEINGTVTEGDGLIANGAGTRGSLPLEGVSVLLLDSQELPITHTITDENGAYSFENLPFGTYKVVVEIVGQEQAERWVTLSAENPVSTGNDFNVGEDGVNTNVAELVESGSFQVFPNPAHDVLNIYLEAEVAFAATVSIRNAAGLNILMEKQNIAAGAQRMTLNIGDLPGGIYFIQIATGAGIVSKKFVKQ